MDHPITSFASPAGWLTAVLRPAGTLDGAAAALLRLLADLSATADMVVVDLAAARVRNVQAFADALRLPSARLARRGRCLLLANMPPALERVVQTGGMPAAVLPADAVPAPAYKRESLGAWRDSSVGADPAGSRCPGEVGRDRDEVGTSPAAHRAPTPALPTGSGRPAA